MKDYIFPLSLGLTALLALPIAQADTGANRDTTSINVDNSVTTEQQRRLALTRQYLMDQQYRSSDQVLSEQRGYGSGVGQGAANSGQAQGHQLDQQQGGVSVGSLVSESGTAHQGGGAAGGLNWQYAPQSNTLMLGGDNNAVIQLSNINANGGNIHIGDVNKGNLHNSQIGSNQYGSQGGDTVNSQNNSQQQRADSQTSSRDQVSN
ncbi:hypothetical protein DV711_02885 [Motiliproteus coralliicola]|uniref:Curlin n=1 Tax=Motiliproteus coralliicola TaxID=2283196 RepID=A0A369WR42_9GAMM|nr:hypothetical protein [Motiliproteus coralliicola]RDE24550.1 hypothetical protein DV711_02885 [Motiliproteus coralliicola]